MDQGSLENMKRRIFLDVGANSGQTVAALFDWDFDQIYCFEPSSVCWRRLKHYARLDDRVRVKRYGLWKETCERTVYGPDTKGGSLWRKDNCTSNEIESCQFRRASDWFRQHLKAGDIVFLKMNCEGAECDILDDLLDSGEFSKVSFAMIDFDVHKIASQKHREAPTRQRLAPFGFPRVAFAEQVMIGPTHQVKIANWLRAVSIASGVGQRVGAEAVAI